MSRAAALACLLVLAGTAHAGGLLAPVGYALERTGAKGVVEGLGPAPALQQALATFACSGTAPLSTGCGPVSFHAAAGARYTIYVVPGTPFAGSISATVADSFGHTVTWTCTYTLYVDGVLRDATCSSSGTGGLVAGTLTLTGATSGTSVGYWEAHVDVS